MRISKPAQVYENEIIDLKSNMATLVDLYLKTLKGESISEHYLDRAWTKQTDLENELKVLKNAFDLVCQAYLVHNKEYYLDTSRYMLEEDDERV